MAKSVGRPARNKSAAAKKHAAQEKARYNKLPVSKRKSIVQTRDKEAQRKADAKRLATQRTERNQYHKEQAAAVKKVPPGGKCSSCGSTKNVERHHIGGKVTKLCPTCHAKARRARK